MRIVINALLLTGPVALCSGVVAPLTVRRESSSGAGNRSCRGGNTADGGCATLSRRTSKRRWVHISA